MQLSDIIWAQLNNVLLIFLLDRMTFNLHKSIKNNYDYKKQCMRVLFSEKMIGQDYSFDIFNSYIFDNIFYVGKCQLFVRFVCKYTYD